MGELDDKIWIWTTEVRSELESVHVICGMLFHSEENKYCRNMQNDVLKYVVLGPSLIPSLIENRERGLVAFLCIFC